MVMLRVMGKWLGAEAVMVAGRGAGAAGIWRVYLPKGSVVTMMALSVPMTSVMVALGRGVPTVVVLTKPVSMTVGVGVGGFGGVGPLPWPLRSMMTRERVYSP